ncbi:MAG: ATPase domain-containing protein [Candidatus Bathyarchaeia archaeon]
MVKLKTGIKGFDELIGGGIESGSRNILYGPPGTGKSVFAMQFLWQGLLEGETVAYDVMDKPFQRLIAYFKFFGWDIEPYIEKGRFIAIQAFPHFEPYLKDPRVIYFNLQDFEEMKHIDRLLSEKGVTRFAAGDFSEQLFALYDLRYMESVEDWTINWCHYDNIVNIDIMTAATQKDITVQRAVDLDFNKAHNIFFFRFNEKKRCRELRISKWRGASTRWSGFPSA